MRTETQKKQRPKRSIFDHFINSVSILILLVLLYAEYGHLRNPTAPMGEYTNLYEKHYDYSLRPPFVISYYLLKPKDYTPRYKYPMVLALHGVSDFTYAGMYLADPQFRARYPAFVVVPIASKRTIWDEAKDKRYALNRGGIKFPDAMPRAVAIVRKVQKQYSVDTTRTYITGHSAGGIGTFGGLARYPHVFAAGVVSAGLWDPRDAPYFLERPVWVLHGSADTQVPVNVTRELVRNIDDLGGTVKYTEFPGAGHKIWPMVYESTAVWDWMFRQRIER